MKIFLRHILVLAACVNAVACYDDSEIVSRIDGLETRVSALEQMNQDMESIHTLIAALQKEVYIKTVTPTSDGYDILLSNGESISLKNGEKGETGETGPAGPQGAAGRTGDQGDTPEIGVSLKEGVYYWTVNGNIVTDADGKMIPVYSTTPKLKLEDGTWYASYDGGSVWEELASSGSSETGFFSSVTVNTTSVVFTLMDGSSFELPLGSGFILDVATNVACLPGVTTGVPYEVTGVSDPVVYCLASGDYTSTVKPETATTGSILITAKNDSAEGQVLVLASNGIKTLIKAITLSKGELVVNEAYTISADGGVLEIPVQTNIEYKAVSSVDWIKISATKADLRNETVTARVEANAQGNPERSGEINICSLDGTKLLGITIVQQGDGSLIIAKYLYPSFEAQTINPANYVSDYVAAGTTSTVDWITVESDGQLTLSENKGIARVGYIKYSNKTICVLQNPGLAFLDLSFEGASGDLATGNRKVVNVGTASKLETGPTTWFTAFRCTDQAYSQPITVIDDETLGHKVGNFHNTLCPSSYGSVLWRNSNGSTVTSMHSGFTVELYLCFNTNLWISSGGAKNSEANAFCYKSTAIDAGNKALSLGVIGNNDGLPVFTSILSGARCTSTYELKDGVYYQFVVTYDASAKKITQYVNGEYIAEKAETRDMSTVLEVGTKTPWWNGASNNICNPWILGGYLNGQWQTPNSCWNGRIANCRVYSSVLSAADIAQSYRVLSTPFSAN